MNKLVGIILSSTVAAGSLMLGGCGEKTLEFRNAEIVNGKIFRRGDDSAFSGKVTNVPDGKILSGQAGFGIALQPVRALVGDFFMDRVLFQSGLCDVKVNDGVPDGEVVCKQPQSETLRYKGAFKDGALTGSFTMYDFSSENNVLTTVDFTEGKPDGKQEIFGMKSHKVVYRVSRDKGVPDGKEEVFDETTGNLISLAMFSKGLTVGELVKYAKDGKQIIARVNFVAGLKEGIEEDNYPDGKPLARIEWEHGKQNGKVSTWDTAGIRKDFVFSDGKDMTPAPVEQASTQAADSVCLDKWLVAYRKEQGADAIVTADQASEFEGYCKQGKNPT